VLGKVQGVTGHLSMNAVAEATPTAIRRLGEESLDLFLLFQGSNPKGEREGKGPYSLARAIGSNPPSAR